MEGTSVSQSVRPGVELRLPDSDPETPSEGPVLGSRQSRRTLSPLGQLTLAARWPRAIVGIAVVALCIGLAVQYAVKAAEGRSAFVRWIPAVRGIVRGEDIYGAGSSYPNPPIMALLLYPLAQLPPVAGALAWFFLKVGFFVTSAAMAFQLVRDGRRRMPVWAAAAAVVLSLRPAMSDLNHGNINLLILFLVVGALRAFRDHRDGVAGLSLALATACKVTPALLCVYLLYKRAWRAALWCAVGLILFLLVIPSVVLGPARNLELLADWADLMIMPYVVEADVEIEQTNQSIPGVIMRLFSETKSVTFEGDPDVAINVAAVAPSRLEWAVRGVVLLIVVGLAALCRAPTERRDRWLLACEYALVLLTMLFICERSWKHHYVTILVPYAAICYALSTARLSRAWKGYLAGTLLASALLMATTSQEISETLFGPMAHKYAQGYGAFLMAGVLLFAALAALVVRSRSAFKRARGSGMQLGAAT